jgi:hypothetical protein
MKLPLAAVLCGLSLFVGACALLPRRDTVAYPSAGGHGRAPTELYVDRVDVDRRVLAAEVERDVKNLVLVLAPGHGFAVVAPSTGNAWPVRVRIVERETIRDFSPQFAIMVSIEMFPSAGAELPALTVVHTSESAESVTSPWALKKILNDCFREAAKAFSKQHSA